MRIINRSADAGQRFYLVVFAALLIIEGSLSGQHLYQQPKPLKPKAELEKIIGPVSENQTSQELNVLWVYGYDEHHIAGAHDYVKVKDLMTDLLSKVEGISVEEVFHFPDDDQFESADLIVMYLHLPQLKEGQFNSLKSFINNGGGVVSLHETAIMRRQIRAKNLRSV